ncbi:MAG: hypothetical protein GQ582_02355, partial [Methyloprofundus sp.]|nr:hypothetical protein [Methyloprofundus sp.]
MSYFKALRKFSIYRVFLLLLTVLLTQTAYAATSTLHVTLANGITGETVPNLRIDAYERLADGSKQWRAKSTTDSQGAAAFELEGLGAGQVYLLRSKPYNGISAYSEDIDSGADFSFKVGTLQLTLVDYLSQATLTDTKVTLYKRLADGSDKWAGSARSDESGMIRFTPVGLENGETYSVRTSSYGAGNAYSPVVSSVSDLTLELGTLAVTVQDFFSQTALADAKVYLYRREADGSSKRMASGTTDAAGLVRFTPFGIEQG